MGLLNSLRFLLAHPLNRQRKLRALIDFACWQLGSRLVPGAVAYDWISGARLLARPGETGVTGNIYAGLHEFAEMAFVMHALRPGELFVDVGSNSGSFTILAACIARANVVAFEPGAEAYERLCANVRLNNVVETVRCHNVAVGASTGSIAFTANSDTVNHVVTDELELRNAPVIPVTTLDTALAGCVPRVLKIDVEGYELSVLEGASKTMAAASLFAVIMETNGSGARYGTDDDAVRAHMRSLGFEEFAYHPLSRELVRSLPADSTDGNTIFLRNPTEVEARLKTAGVLEIKQQLL